MFVSVNMDTLQFLHKHHDQMVLGALSFLEAPNHTIRNENATSDNFLLGLTELELRMLYKNTTGSDVVNIDERAIREVLAIIVETKIKPTLALESEVIAQIQAVEDDLHACIPWKYALGSTKPAKAMELFPLVCDPLTDKEIERAVLSAPQRRSQRAAPNTAPKPKAPPQPLPAPKVRASNVRPVIWAVADRLWQAAGSPKDKAVVLNLRREMMTVLENEHSIKRTSSSNELGKWMLDRLSN